MNVVADYDRCEGHGLCAEAAPAIFEVDDDGELVHRFDGVDLPADLVDPAKRAIDSCPVAALRQQ